MPTILKVDCDGEIQRLPLPAPASFEQILEQVRAAWPLQLSAGAALKYEDEEGDLCTLTPSTMQDLLAVQPATGDQHVLRLKLVRKAPGAPVTAPALRALEPSESAQPAAPATAPAALSGGVATRLTPEPVEPPALSNNVAAVPTGALAAPEPSAPPLEPSAPPLPAEPAPPAQPQPTAPPPPPRRNTGSHTAFPIQIQQTHTVPHNGAQVEMNVRISLWSVWPEGYGVAGCVWQADVSPWIPSAQLEIQLPADTEVRNIWSADVVHRSHSGLVKLRLAPYPTTCFGGNLGLRGDPSTCAERLVETLGG